MIDDHRSGLWVLDYTESVIFTRSVVLNAASERYKLWFVTLDTIVFATLQGMDMAVVLSSHGNVVSSLKCSNSSRLIHWRVYRTHGVRRPYEQSIIMPIVMVWADIKSIMTPGCVILSMRNPRSHAWWWQESSRKMCPSVGCKWWMRLSGHIMHLAMITPKIRGSSKTGRLSATLISRKSRLGLWDCYNTQGLSRLMWWMLRRLVAIPERFPLRRAYQRRNVRRRWTRRQLLCVSWKTPASFLVLTASFPLLKCAGTCVNASWIE